MKLGVIEGHTETNKVVALLYDKETNQICSAIFNSRVEANAFVHFAKERGLADLIEDNKPTQQAVQDYLFLFRHSEGCD